MKQKNSVLLLLFCNSLSLLHGQVELDFSNGCNFASDKTAGKYTLFEPTEEAEKIVDEILELTGITGGRPFTLQVATVENAQANERKGVRYLLYSQKFMQQFKLDAKTKWAAYFVFAHEIGHHVRGHNFNETDPKLRKKMELEADRFAAVAMARLKVSRNDALAAAKNLRAGTYIKPEYYPDVAAREEAISIEYDKEAKKILDAEKGKAGADKLFIAIDPASYNRWNLIPSNSASAFITDEKVVVNFKIPAQYNNQMVNVILCSLNPNIRVNTLIGTGSTTGKVNEVAWNYQMDNVPKAMASQPNQLRIYVYAANEMPKARISPETKKKCWILGGAGALVGLVGIWPYTDALSKHDNYAKYLNRDDPFYVAEGTDRDGYYDKADKEYVGAQVMIYTGGALVLGSIIWSVIEKGKAKKELKNTICTTRPHWKLEPVLITNGLPGVGLSVRF